eukprot:4207576-Pyramimonas_sp.AAC.1
MVGFFFDLRPQGRFQRAGQSRQGRNARRLATEAHRPTPRCTREGQNEPNWSRPEERKSAAD